MSDIIQLLPDSVANQIAAGEVIQRPASVIKELVENSVDAGAHTVNVLVVDAGRTSIQVIDDGCGMSETDARLAFERHATSKIREAGDLFALNTMGFRGEALPSIVAVAQVELKTRQEGDDVGTQLSIAGSRFTGQQPCSCPVGSNFMVQNLFYNVPARRKFLKSNATELNNIVTAFQRIALVYPSVAFTLHSNGTEMFNLKACGTRQRIVDIFGKKINPMLLPVSVDTTLCKISGFVGKPESARKKGALQYFFVNGRYMKHPYFHKAVATAFERLIPEGEQVPYFIYFDVAPENIDVNIHPTKTEIKFENEQAIWQILAAAVKDTLGMFNDIPSLDFDTQGSPDIPVFGSGSGAEMPKVQYNPQYNPFSETPSPRDKQSVQGWEQLFEGLQGNHSDTPSMFDEQAAADDAPQQESAIADKSPIHYQYKGQYIMVAVKSGLLIIDQHRAHVRILYERYLQQVEEQKSYAQKVLFPEVIHLSASEDITMQTILPEFSALGFELESLGAGAYAINSVPSGINGVNYVTLVQDMLASAAETGTSAVAEINRTLSLELARKSAVDYGQVLSDDEMANIVDSLFACSNYNYTPDGKKVICMLKQTEIDHLFA